MNQLSMLMGYTTNHFMDISSECRDVTSDKPTLLILHLWSEHELGIVFPEKVDGHPPMNGA